VIHVSDLAARVSGHPGAAMALLALTLGRLSEADERRREFATAESLGRVTRRLAELAERFGESRTNGVVEVALPIRACVVERIVARVDGTALADAA
jgi:CRP/FNR family transcriptional regulator, cyclic AMP receptor protein